MTSLEELSARMGQGQVVVIDGGTGTEIQRWGVAMDGDTWCAETNLNAPEVVQAVHQAYINAGAELIIANTFATSPLLFDHLGRADEVAAIDAVAVDLARRTSQGRVPVAGSVSTMRPVATGSDRNVAVPSWTESAARQLFKGKVTQLAEAGVDLLITEMMRDTDYARWATEEALATGLPTWVGLSVERDASGRLVGWGRADCPAEEVIGVLCELKPDLVAVMHSSADDTSEAVEAVRAAYSGPIGVYPEAGHFTMPDWVFADLSADQLVASTTRWVEQGAVMDGGRDRGINRLAPEIAWLIHM